MAGTTGRGKNRAIGAIMKRKVVLFGLFFLVMSLSSCILYSDGGEEITKVANLPNTADYSVDGKHVDIGIISKQFKVFDIPAWNYDKRWCLTYGNGTYIEMDKATLDEIALEAGVSVPKTMTFISFGQSIGGKLLLLLMILIWGWIQSRIVEAKRKKEEDLTIQDGQSIDNFETMEENGQLVIVGYTGNGGEVLIPSSIQDKPVAVIGDDVFCNKNLTKVTIPNSITTIRALAFSANQLTSVTIPDSVTEIGECAFIGNQLTSVTIPNSVTSIGLGAFFENQLTSVTIPDSVAAIGERAFSDNQLTSATIGSNIELDNTAFDNGLAEYYNSNGKKAGTYTYDGNGWSYEAR
jgi:hypothetical protein